MDHELLCIDYWCCNLPSSSTALPKRDSDYNLFLIQRKRNKARNLKCTMQSVQNNQQAVNSAHPSQCLHSFLAKNTPAIKSRYTMNHCAC